MTFKDLFSDRPDAYARLVERALASPRCGERWAQHWLDVVRFAESNGFETNIERPNAWPYRDYVIAAFNGDKPIDKFIAEQLAGDAGAAVGHLHRRAVHWALGVGLDCSWQEKHNS